jgi:hypothetical protein
MADLREIDITDLAVLGKQFPLRLMQLGFGSYRSWMGHFLWQ